MRKVVRDDTRPIDESGPMMAGIFAALTAAFLLNVAGWGRLAVFCLLACLALSVGLFLWEIYSPEYGFRMPWLQVERERTVLPIWRG